MRARSATWTKACACTVTWGLRSAIAGGLYFHGTLAYAQGDALRAAALWQESVRMGRAQANPDGIASGLVDLAMVALDQDDGTQAGVYLAESLRTFRELDERFTIFHALEVCARLAMLRGRQADDARAESSRAARLLGAAEALRTRLDTPLLAIYGEHYRRSVASLRSQLDAATLAVAWAEGQTMTLEQAIALRA